MGKQLTTEDFIARAKAVWGDRFDYSKSVYSKNSIKLCVICREHGEFWTAPAHFWRGKGCPKCKGAKARELLNSDTSQFIQKAIQKHGLKYDYSLVEYVRSNINVKILCKEHGVFEQSPDNHLHGCGCPTCSRHGFDPSLDGVVYILASDGVVKVGISNKSGKSRADSITKSSGEEFSVVHEISLSGQNCIFVEKQMLRNLRLLYDNPINKYNGYTECFTGVPILDVIRMLHEEVTKILDKE